MAMVEGVFTEDGGWSAARGSGYRSLTAEEVEVMQTMAATTTPIFGGPHNVPWERTHPVAREVWATRERFTDGQLREQATEYVASWLRKDGKSVVTAEEQLSIEAEQQRLRDDNAGKLAAKLTEEERREITERYLAHVRKRTVSAEEHEAMVLHRMGELRRRDQELHRIRNGHAGHTDSDSHA